MNFRIAATIFPFQQDAWFDLQAVGDGGEHFAGGKALARFPLAPGGFGDAEGICGRIHFQARLLSQAHQIAGKKAVKTVVLAGFGFCFSGGHGWI